MPLDAHQLRSLSLHGEPPPGPKVRKVRSSPEWQLQFQLFKWWKQYCRENSLSDVLLFSIPNGASLSGGNAAWQKAERGRKGNMLKMTGMTNGVADLFLAAPYRGAGAFTGGFVAHGLFLELKSPTGIVSDDQRVFASAVVAQGYRHVVVRSLDEAVKTIQEYLA